MIGAGPNSVRLLPHTDHAHDRRLCLRRSVGRVPFTLRNSRTVSADTSAACAAGAAFDGPATTTGLSSAMPANLPSSSNAAAPEKPIAGAGASTRSVLLPAWAIEALTLLAAAPPPWFCGSAIPVSSTLVFAAPLLRPSGFNPHAP